MRAVASASAAALCEEKDAWEARICSSRPCRAATSAPTPFRFALYCSSSWLDMPNVAISFSSWATRRDPAEVAFSLAAATPAQALTMDWELDCTDAVTSVMSDFSCPVFADMLMISEPTVTAPDGISNSQKQPAVAGIDTITRLRSRQRAPHTP